MIILGNTKRPMEKPLVPFEYISTVIKWKKIFKLQFKRNSKK